MERSFDYRERRRYPRIVFNLPLEYQEKGDSFLYGGIAVNAGEGGFLIESTKDIPVGMELNVTVMFLKGLELGDFKAVAQIVWKESYSKEDWKGNQHWEGYQYGLEFIQILDEDRWKLRQLLNGRYHQDQITSNL
jgi:hypothetical protein